MKEHEHFEPNQDSRPEFDEEINTEADMDHEASFEPPTMAEPGERPNLVAESSRRNDYFLGVCIFAAGLMISGSVLYSSMRGGGGSGTGTNGAAPGANNPPAAEAVPQLKDTDIVLGDAKAKVTMFEFADYQCPFCARFHSETSPQVRSTYVGAGKVKMVYRDFAFLGQESLDAAEAARCAADQSKFWEYHDALYDAEIKDGHENNGNLNRALFLSLASNLKLDADKFAACIDGKKYDKLISDERADAANYGVNSTPTFFIGKNKILGAQPFDVMQSTIEGELKNS